MSHIPDSVLNEWSKTAVNKEEMSCSLQALFIKQERQTIVKLINIYSTKWVTAKVYKGKYSGEGNETVFIIQVEKTSEEVADE